MEIELEHIPKPTRDDMLSELRRVATLVESTHLTRTQFDLLARVSSSAIARNFGGWSAALHLAGVAHKYSGRVVSPRMKAHAARQCADEELLQSLHRVAEQLGSKTVTMAQFNASDEPINASALTRRFGSWQAALAKVGLTIAPLGRRHTADDYFENLLAVWTHLGRQPYYREMDVPPSRITSSGYAAKFGSWRKAILAFMERVTISSSVSAVPEPAASSRQPGTTRQPTKRAHAGDVRSVPLGLRYNVLRRDRFRCVLCGASPAQDLHCELHVDHIFPFSAGGRTTIDNLRTLCQNCNLGKGAKREDNERT